MQGISSWANHLTSLSFDFHICKTGLIISECFCSFKCHANRKYASFEIKEVKEKSGTSTEISWPRNQLVVRERNTYFSIHVAEL